MKKTLFAAILAFFVLSSRAQDSQTAFNFLRLPASAHVAALGGDNITLPDDDGSLVFHNPSLISTTATRTLGLNMMTYMQGTVAASAQLVSPVGERGAWSAQARFVSFGEIKETTSSNEQTGTFTAKDIAVGGTFAYTKPYDSTNKVWSNSGTEWGVDLRARYAFTEKLSVTTMHNISSGYDSSEDDNTLVLWDMLNLTYKVNDKASVGFTANATFDNLDSDHVFTGADLVGSPYVRIDANERVAVTASIRAEASGVNPKIDGHETVDVTIPVIFAFNY